MAALNLRALVREVIVTSTLDENREIADEVIRRLSSREVREALAQALPKFVSQIVSEIRGDVRFDFVPAAESVLLDPTSAEGRVGFVASSKVASIREHWRLTLRLHKVATEHGQKKLGDCTREDLLYAVKVREEQGRRNLAKAKEYKALASTLNEYGAATVADLPDEVLRVAIGQVAA